MSVKREPRPISEVVFHAYPKLIFIWPLLVFGYLFYFITPDIKGPGEPQTSASVSASVSASISALGAAGNPGDSPKQPDAAPTAAPVAAPVAPALESPVDPAIDPVPEPATTNQLTGLKEPPAAQRAPTPKQPAAQPALPQPAPAPAPAPAPVPHVAPAPAAATHLGPLPPQAYLEVLGWLYLLVVVLVVLTLGVDIERNYAAFWLVLGGMFFFLGKWLSDSQGITVFGNLYRWLASLDVRYDRRTALALSVLLTPPFVVMLGWSRLQHKWRITHNEFEHFSFGRSDDALARGAKRVRTTYPDLFELLLAGAGTLIVYSASGKTELRRINHVPMLPIISRKITRLLEQVSVVSDVDGESLESEEAEGEGAALGGEEGGPASDAAEPMGGEGQGKELGGERL